MKRKGKFNLGCIRLIDEAVHSLVDTEKEIAKFRIEHHLGATFIPINEIGKCLMQQ